MKLEFWDCTEAWRMKLEIVQKLEFWDGIEAWSLTLYKSLKLEARDCTEAWSLSLHKSLKKTEICSFFGESYKPSSGTDRWDDYFPWISATATTTTKTLCFFLSNKRPIYFRSIHTAALVSSIPDEMLFCFWSVIVKKAKSKQKTKTVVTKFFSSFFPPFNFLPLSSFHVSDVYCCTENDDHHLLVAAFFPLQARVMFLTKAR